jgi:WD40 repeat protein
VRLWDLTDPYHPVALGSPLTGATNYVYSVAFSPDGRTLIAGSIDNRVLMWDVSNLRTPTLLESLAAAGDSIFVVAVSPDGRTLAAGTAEKAVRLWTIDPGRAAVEVCEMAGDPITQQEWTQYVPNRPYQPPC